MVFLYRSQHNVSRSADVVKGGLCFTLSLCESSAYDAANTPFPSDEVNTFRDFYSDRIGGV